LEKGEIEANVVPDDGGRSDERGELAKRDRGWWRAPQILVADAGESRDRGMQIDARVDEGAETLADVHRSVWCEADVGSADLDDGIGRRIEPGGLEVERDELYVGLGSSAAQRRGVRSSSHRSWHLSCTFPRPHSKEDDVAEKEQEKPDFAPKEYKMPKFDFSDTDVGKKAAAETATKTHTVESGDSLWAIAEAELGDGKRWKEIYELNKDVIGDNPDLIKPGQELKLPS